MQTGRHGHCVRMGIYGASVGSEDTGRLKSQGELCSAVSCHFLHTGLLCRYELSRCDVPPKLWSALPPRSGLQGDARQPPATGETSRTFFFFFLMAGIYDFL